MLTKTMAESMENIPDEKKVNKNADKEIDKGVRKKLLVDEMIIGGQSDV